MGDRIATKDRIIDASLTLFSEKGYDGVGVDMIAEMVGMKGPSLYRYFKGKEDILNSLVEIAEDYYEKYFVNAVLHMERYPKSMNELIDINKQNIYIMMHDPQVKKIRKILSIEQFRNDQLKALTTKHHLTGIEDVHTAIFEKMMQNGMLKRDDPRLLAFEFVAPIALLLQVMEREPDREQEIIDKIKRHMEHFVKMYAL